MRALSKTLQHSPIRSAAFWALGCVGLVLFFRAVLRSAHAERPTLGAFSWLFRGLIRAGQALESIVSAHSSTLIAAVFVLAAASLVLPGVRRALVPRSLVAGMLASLFALLSIVNMTEIDFGRAVGYAIASAIMLIAGGCIPTTKDLSCAREWPIWVPLGVAVLFRFWSLAEIPRGFAQHAAVHLQISRKVAEALWELLTTFNPAPVLRLSVYLRDQHGPMSMVDGLGLFVFGVGMVEARMTQAVLGCCAVAAAYGLGKVLEGPRLGFLFAFLLAVSPWHLAFSRYGDGEHVVPTLHVLLAMWLLVRAVRFGRTHDYVLCGLVVGLSWYVYATNQVVPIITAFFLLFKIVSTRGFWTRDWTKLVLLAALVMVVSYPHVGVQLETGDIWLARSPLDELRPEAMHQFLTVSDSAIQLFEQVNDPWFFRPGGGLGHAVQSLVIIGFIVCLAGFFFRRQRDASVLLVLWIGLGFVPAVLSSPHFRRLLLVAVVGLVMSSIAILRTLDLLENGGWSKKAVSSILIVVCVLFMAAGAYVYFDQVRIFECNHHIDHTQLARYATRNMMDSYVYVYAPFDDYRQEIEEFLELMAYRQSAAIRSRGAVEEDYFQVLTPDKLPQAVEFIRNIGREVHVVAHDSAEWWAEGSDGLEGSLEIPECRNERDGDLTIWKCTSVPDRQPVYLHPDTENEGE